VVSWGRKWPLVLGGAGGSMVQLTEVSGLCSGRPYMGAIRPDADAGFRAS
jgi:hypothetical protein